METQEQEKQGGIILSDTTQKIVDVIKILEAVIKDKNASRQEQYRARQAATELKLMVADKVVG